MLRPKSLLNLVFISVALSIWAVLRRYINSPTGPMVFAGICLMLAYYRSNRPITLPRSITAIVALGAVLILTSAVSWARIPPGTALAYFLTALMLIMSFCLRTLSDCAKIMVLSVLAIIAAGAFTDPKEYPVAAVAFNDSPEYAVTLILYLAIAGYCLYKRHLISEFLAHRTPAEEMVPITVAGSSGRGWVTAYVTAGTMTCGLALTIFWFVPRRPPSWPMFVSAKRPLTYTGFSEKLELGEMAKLLEDKTPVLRVKLLKETGQPGYTPALYLRGSVLTNYVVGRRRRWRWIYDGLDTVTTQVQTSTLSRPKEFLPIPLTSLSKLPIWRFYYEQQISSQMFVVDKPVAVAANRPAVLSYCPTTNTLRGSKAPEKGFCYALWAERISGRYTVSTRAKRDQQMGRVWGRAGLVGPSGIEQFLASRKLRPVDLAPFREFVRKIMPETSSGMSVMDRARKIETYLRMNFRYSLDNSDVDPHVEPVMDFLRRRRRGHCEYFASAMTLLCRSLDLDARVVTGFKGGEYNSFGSYYVVRRCDAHAWVEVRDPGRGWVRFDPTPPDRDELLRAEVNDRFKLLWDIVDLMRFNWLSRVANYDVNERREFIDSLRRRLLGGEDKSITSPIKRLAEFVIDLLRTDEYQSRWCQFLHLVVTILVVLLIVFSSWTVVVMIRRCVTLFYAFVRRGWSRRFGNLWACPVDFYRRALLALAGKGIIKPMNRTAGEFVRDLERQGSDVSAELAVLTDAYLAVRFGARTLSRDQRDRVEGALNQLKAKLPETNAAKRSVSDSNKPISTRNRW